MHKISFQDLAITPWKNGAGTTRQILIHPADATLDNFAFRVSAADVNTLGPFSDYRGIQRSLAVLTGTGLTLAMADGHSMSFIPKCTVVDFEGGQAPVTTACPEPVLDIGVMSRTGIYSHSFAQTNYACQQTHHVTAAHGLLFCLNNQPVIFQSDTNRYVLQPFDAIVFEQGLSFHLSTATANTSLPFFVALFMPQSV